MERNLIVILVIAVAAGAMFAWLWKAGHVDRLANYVKGTNEELKKCSWPSWDELKGSTTIVAICIFLLGGFTFLVDQVLFRLFFLFKI